MARRRTSKALDELEGRHKEILQQYVNGAIKSKECIEMRRELEALMKKERKKLKIKS